MSDERLDEIRDKIKIERVRVHSTVEGEVLAYVDGLDYSEVDGDDILWLIQRVRELEQANRRLRDGR